MPYERLRPFAVGGGARPDALTGLNQQFAGSIADMFDAAPENVRGQLRISSAYRSPQRQSEILSGVLQKRVGGDAVSQWQNYVSQANGDVVAAGEAARPWLREMGITKWVAPPGSSNHQKGVAVDLQYLNPAARQWMHANAPKYGLNFPLSNEDWHLEPANARQMAGGSSLPAMAGGQTRMTMPPEAGPAPQPLRPGTAVPMLAQPGAPAPMAFQPQQAMAQMALAQMFTQQQVQQAETDRQVAEQRQAEVARRRALFG